MRILIIEDEHYAAKRLTNMVQKMLPNAKILEPLDSVEESKQNVIVNRSMIIK